MGRCLRRGREYRSGLHTRILVCCGDMALSTGGRLHSPPSQPREAAGEAAGEVQAEAGAFGGGASGESRGGGQGRSCSGDGGGEGGTQLPSTRSPHRQGVPLELSWHQPVDGHVCRPARPRRAVDRQLACSPRAAAPSLTLTFLLSRLSLVYREN